MRGFLFQAAQRTALMALLYVISYSFFDAFLPAWIWRIVEPLLFWPFLIVLVMAPQLSPALMKRVFLYSSPFWIWSAARYVVGESPIAAMVPASEYRVIIAVVAPAGVAVLGWLYWYLLRWQEISRTAILPIAMIYHLATIALAILNGLMTQVVWAWALGSLVPTFFLAATMIPEKKELYVSAAMFCAAAVLVLAI